MARSRADPLKQTSLFPSRCHRTLRTRRGRSPKCRSRRTVERAASTHVQTSGERDPLNRTAPPGCAVHIFRCYFLNADEHIEACEVIEVASLGEGIDRALAMLKARPQHRNVELWDGARRVY